MVRGEERLQWLGGGAVAMVRGRSRGRAPGSCLFLCVRVFSRWRVSKETKRGCFERSLGCRRAVYAVTSKQTAERGPRWD